MHIPFLDLKQINASYAEQYQKALVRVIDSGRYILGQELDAFENELAHFCEASYCIGVGNGLDALTIALRALGVGPGDEVLVPANTFVASFLAISAVGAVPIPIDIHADTLLIDTCEIEAKITSLTKAIMPVHLYGQVCDMDEINRIACKHGLHILEDAAQAHGARYKGKSIGSLSAASGYSFYPGKNLGALGDGGAIVTNNSKFAERARVLSNYGSTTKYRHREKGVNTRPEALPAAFLRIPLQDLAEDNIKRMSIAEYYLDNINNCYVTLPQVPKCTTPVWHLFVVRVPDRKRFISYLTENKIDSLIHYPVNCHKQECYQELKNHCCPVAEKVANEIVSIPISPVMNKKQREYVVKTINGWRK